MIDQVDLMSGRLDLPGLRTRIEGFFQCETNPGKDRSLKIAKTRFFWNFFRHRLFHCRSIHKHIETLPEIFD